jgi:hypothetical protein|tara:strand:+ start:52123 stop:52443 length:321 start_codon:yes stop_codon:yes gene_type:complete
MKDSIARALSDLGLIAEQQLELTSKGDIESALLCQHLFHRELDSIMERLRPADYAEAIPQLERMQNIFKSAHQTAEDILRLRKKSAGVSQRQRRREDSYTRASSME